MVDHSQTVNKKILVYVIYYFILVLFVCLLVLLTYESDRRNRITIQ